MKNHWPRFLLLAVLLALVAIASPGLSRPAAALSNDIVISQVYGGGGNTGATLKSDFIELFNRGSSPVDLTGWSVQYASATGTSWTVTALNPPVSLQPGQYYLVKEADGANAAATPLPTPDATGTIAMGGTAGKVALVSSTTALTGACPTIGVVDFAGFGTTANCFEGTGPTPAPSNTNAVLRAGGGCTETDQNAADFAAGAPNPRNTATTFNVCGGGITLSINDVSLNEGDAGTTSFVFTVALSAAAPAGGVTYDIATADDTATDANNDYEPQTLTGQTIAEGQFQKTFTVLVNGDTTAEPNETFFVNVTNVTGTGVTVADGQGRGTIVNDDAAIVLIHDVQGNGATSPMYGNLVTIEGIVVGDFQDTTTDPPNELNGYFVQEEDGDADADPATSEGIFVYEDANPATPAVAVGDKVRVSGTVVEFGDVAGGTYTQIGGSLTVQVVSSGNTLPTAATIDLPVASLADYEKVESMLVTFVDELTVTEVFTLGRYGEVLLSAGSRLLNPTHAAEPGAPAQAVRDANILRSIILDDGLTNQNPDPLRYPEPGGLSATNTLRGGDTTTSLTGVMHFLDVTEDYRVQPIGAITWNHVNPRPTDAPTVGGSLHVVGTNTLNYFTTVDPNANDNDSFTADDVCGPDYDGVNVATGMECRGADSPDEFNRQHDKFINMLLELDADIVGLNELENNAAAAPANDDSDPVLESIVDALNAQLGVGTYDFIDAGTIGTDAIKVALIYKPDSVTPVGPFNILTSAYDSDFIDTRNRPVLAQTFEDNNGSVFTVAVAHLKSKGSGCGTGDDASDTAGGNCNGTRTRAAEVMVQWFAEPTVNNGDPDILLVGDLNSYAKEDPIDVFVNAGYVDLAATLTNPYSYVFDGEWGYLDYGMASPTMALQVADVAEWHINADEPIVLDYNLEFKSDAQDVSFYSPLPFRVSDHDPILVGLNLDQPPDTTAPDVTINQASGQVDPTSASPINFTVFFNEPVTGFGDVATDVSLSGTAGATTAVVTQVSPMDGTTYNVAVSGMTGSGTVIATVPAGAAQDAATNTNNDSTSTDNTVTYNEPVMEEEAIFITTKTAGTVGSLAYGSEDILKWDGSAWSTWFDGSAHGLVPVQAKHNINAFYIPDETGEEVIISFGQNSRYIPGIPTKVDGMDLVRWDGSAFSLYFDGSDVGLTLMVYEKIDGLHILPGALSPIGGGCQAYMLISTQGPGRVPKFGGGTLRFGGEDILGFCATNLGSATAGWWHMVLDGSTVGLPKNAIDSLSANDDGSVIYMTMARPVSVNSAVGGHSMVFAYDTTTQLFSGPIFSAPAEGINRQVNGLHFSGDIAP